MKGDRIAEVSQPAALGWHIAVYGVDYLHGTQLHGHSIIHALLEEGKRKRHFEAARN